MAVMNMDSNELYGRIVRVLINVRTFLSSKDEEDAVLDEALHAQIDKLAQVFVSSVGNIRDDIMQEILAGKGEKLDSESVSPPTRCFMESIHGFGMLHQLVIANDDEAREVYDDFAKHFLSVTAEALHVTKEETDLLAEHMVTEYKERAKWRTNPEGFWQHLWYQAKTRTDMSALEREDLRNSIYNLLLQWSGVRQEHLVRTLPDVVRPKSATALRDFMLKFEAVFTDEYLFAEKAFVEILYTQAMDFRTKFSKKEVGAVPPEQPKEKEGGT